MKEENITTLPWRELTEEEYEKEKKENMPFYKAIDIIAFCIIVGFSVNILLSIISSLDNSILKELPNLIISTLLIALVLKGKNFLRKKGLTDIEERNLVACDVILENAESETYVRKGNTRYRHFMTVKTPNNETLKIETTSAKISAYEEGTTITIIKPKDSYDIKTITIL